MKILITGGAGYIGSHINRAMSGVGHDTFVIDDLSKGYEKLVKWGKFLKGDVGDSKLLDTIFAENEIDLVIHCATFVQITESIREPEKYYKNNFYNSLVLIEAMKRAGVKKMLFSSTTGVYGEPKYIPIDENHPKVPISPYGWSKLMVEQLLWDAQRAWGLESIVFRYINVSGASSDLSIGQLYEPATHLVAICFEAIVGRRPEVEVHGTDWATKDGTFVRDYIHVEDLASAHLLALKYLDNVGVNEAFNLGSGNGYTVWEVIESVKRVTGQNFVVKNIGRRIGDVETMIGSSKKAKDLLGWEPKWTELDKIIDSAWMWFKKNN